MKENRTHISDNGRYFFYLLGAAIVYLTFLLVRSYLGIIIMSFITAVFFQPVYSYFLRLTQKKEGVASFLTMLTILITVFIPILIVVNMTVRQVTLFTSDVRNIVSSGDLNVTNLVVQANSLIEKVPGVDYRLTEDELLINSETALKNLGKTILDRAISVGGSSIAAIGNLFIYLLITFFMFPARKRIIRLLLQLSPLKDEVDKLYIRKASAMAKSMVRGTFLIAFIQGSISGIFLWMAGVEYVMFWTLLMILFGVLPYVGTGIFILPIGIFKILSGDIFWGVFLIASNLLFVAQIDNVIRPSLVSKEAQLHPALVLLGVIGGIKMFGSLGFIYGPMIMILLMTTVEVFLKEYKPTK